MPKGVGRWWGWGGAGRPDRRRLPFARRGRRGVVVASPWRSAVPPDPDGPSVPPPAGPDPPFVDASARPRRRTRGRGSSGPRRARDGRGRRAAPEDHGLPCRRTTEERDRGGTTRQEGVTAVAFVARSKTAGGERPKVSLGRPRRSLLRASPYFRPAARPRARVDFADAPPKARKDGTFVSRRDAREATGIDAARARATAELHPRGG